MESLTALSANLGRLLKANGQSVAVAESSTGGLISAALLAVPGASAFFLGGGVIYTAPARAELLRISRDDVTGIRSATEAYASLLAGRVREILGATWGLGETGAAGPTGNPYGDAPGHTCIAVSGPTGRAITLETGAADREANMWAFTKAALELFESCIEGGAQNR